MFLKCKLQAATEAAMNQMSSLAFFEVVQHRPKWALLTSENICSQRRVFVKTHPPQKFKDIQIKTLLLSDMTCLQTEIAQMGKNMQIESVLISSSCHFMFEMNKWSKKKAFQNLISGLLGFRSNWISEQPARVTITVTV